MNAKATEKKVGKDQSKVSVLLILVKQAAQHKDINYLKSLLFPDLCRIKSVAPECTPDSSECSGGVFEEEVETESLL